jgi:hypothetical protein
MGKTTSGPDHEYTNHGFIRGTQVSRGGLRPRPRPRVYKPRIYPWNTGQSRWSQTTAQTMSIQTTDLSVEHRSVAVGSDHEYTNHGFIRGTQVSRGSLRPRPRP